MAIVYMISFLGYHVGTFHVAHGDDGAHSVFLPSESYWMVPGTVKVTTGE